MFDWIGDAIDWIGDGISSLWDSSVLVLDLNGQLNHYTYFEIYVIISK